MEKGIAKAVLFGSYAKGLADDNSDVDICIDSRGKLKGFDFIDVMEDIREKLQKEVDLIDVTHIDKGSRVEQEINSTGVMIYEKF
ncbi:MAG: nucleotidyltransferase domain-containing protein [Cellulosilyticaceae bacterium]